MTRQTDEPKMLTLPERLRMKADMITMGERIEFGSECLIMHEAAEEIERLKRQVICAKDTLEWAVKHYANPEINHVDYRVTVCKMAEKALTQHQPTGDVVEHLSYIESLAGEMPKNIENVHAILLHCKVIRSRLAALPQQPALPQGITEDEALEIIRSTMDGLDIWENGVHEDDVQEQVCKEIYRALLAANALPPKSEVKEIGLPIEQEPKYTTNGRAIINRASGEEIPADEPVFIFRARDELAVGALYQYLQVIAESDHHEAVSSRLDDFRRFKAQHPERMKQPDTVPFPKPLSATAKGGE